MSSYALGLTGGGVTVTAIDDLVRALFEAARIPGGALAIVRGRDMICKAYGYSDVQSRRPMDLATHYPIASTTKAINATLIGILQDEGLLSWDQPVREHIPDFRLADPTFNPTLRDLVSMRTGLPRHDWLWRHHPMPRASLVTRLSHLAPAASFGEKFQYNNLTATLAGHVAEVAAGQSWEELVRDRILRPLAMTDTGFEPMGTSTVSYHENGTGRLAASHPWDVAWTAPAGTAIHSTIEDMAKWVAFNLAQATDRTPAIISEHSLEELRNPQIDVGDDPSGPTPEAKYGLGWFIDRYNGQQRISHSGYLSDVSSDVSLFPEQRIGIVSFLNAGAMVPARMLNEHIFDLLSGRDPVRSVDDRLGEYKARVSDHLKRRKEAGHGAVTGPRRSLPEYAGIYAHPGYGLFEFREQGNRLYLKRGDLWLHMDHWADDSWIAEDERFFSQHVAHPFDVLNPITFELDSAELVSAVSIKLEPKLSPIRLEKQRSDAR